MTPAAWLVARRALVDRPWRSALLLLGYGTGVAIMIVLLSVGDALLDEARDRNLVAGGDVVVLPEGVDPAVIKVNGVTGLFLTIPNARYIVRDLLDGPRFHAIVAAAAPQLSDRLIYVRVRGRVVAATASAGIPSLDRAARAARAVAGGVDSPADRAWLDPPLPELAGRLDHFHEPPAAGEMAPAGGPPSPDRAGWAEWDYFNVIDPRSHAYAYLTLLAGANGKGAIIARIRRPGVPLQDVVLPARIGPADISTVSADQRVGPARVRVGAEGYRVTVRDPRLRVDLRIRPDRGFTLPPTEVRVDGAISGYVVPIVRGRADGAITTAAGTLVLKNAPAYHDHNWGTWRGVTWEWGEAASTSGAYVYGNVHLPRGEASEGGQFGTLFVWGAHGVAPARPAFPAPSGAEQTERGGLMAALPITRITYTGWHPGPAAGGRRVRAPAQIMVRAASGPDSVLLTIRVWDALGSRPLGAQAGAAEAAQAFLQLRGDADLQGTIGGRAIAWQGPAASETFVGP
ncbi:MAG TPA: hypothetical protein VKW09_13430 [bacterium]|nr:hypothetical protein [bacterium]